MDPRAPGSIRRTGRCGRCQQGRFAPVPEAGGKAACFSRSAHPHPLFLLRNGPFWGCRVPPLQTSALQAAFPRAGGAALPEHPSPGTGRALLNDLVPSFPPLPLTGGVKAAPHCCFSARPELPLGEIFLHRDPFPSPPSPPAPGPAPLGLLGCFSCVWECSRVGRWLSGGGGRWGPLCPWLLRRSGGFLVGSGGGGRPTAP